MPIVATRRIVGSNHGPTTLNRRRVKIYFQSYPGTSAASGIAGLQFSVKVGTSPVVTGTTPGDGLIEIWLASGETASLKVLGTEYTVSALAGVPFPITELRGVQQRLNMLGYNAGTLHADNLEAKKFIMDGEGNERAVINFQSDNDPLFIDALSGSQTQARLQKIVRGAGGE
jgi:peptidoglycan hydrolase-like protein with peptidoglycan-binding domain